MELNTQIFGKGKPLIIIHGFLGMGDNWKTIAKKLADHYEVHLPDMRNHGKSPHSSDFSYDIMVQDVNNYMNAHNLDKVRLIGHSMGGKIAMQFASEHPDLVEKLVVVDISPKLYQPHHDEILKSLKKLKESHLESRTQAEEILSETIKDKGVRLFLLKNLKRETDNKLSLKPNIDIFIQNRHEIGKALPEKCKFNGETLFIKGENSSYIRTNDKKLINEHFPNFKVIEIKNSSHWVHAENPRDFLSQLVDFL